MRGRIRIRVATSRIWIVPEEYIIHKIIMILNSHTRFRSVIHAKSERRRKL